MADLAQHHPLTEPGDAEVFCGYDNENWPCLVARVTAVLWTAYEDMGRDMEHEERADFEEMAQAVVDRFTLTERALRGAVTRKPSDVFGRTDREETP